MGYAPTAKPIPVCPSYQVPIPIACRRLRRLHRRAGALLKNKAPAPLPERFARAWNTAINEGLELPFVIDHETTAYHAAYAASAADTAAMRQGNRDMHTDWINTFRHQLQNWTVEGMKWAA